MTTELSPKAKENLQRNAAVKTKRQQVHKVAAKRKESLSIRSRENRTIEAEFNGKKSQRYSIQ